MAINCLTINESRKITEIRFKDFSVVQKAILETWSNIPNFSIITGSNGSGKSRLLAYIINRIRNEQPNLIFFEDRVQFKGTKLLKEITRLKSNDPVYFLNNYKWYIEPVTDCLDELSSFFDNKKHIEPSFNEIISHIQKTKTNIENGLFREFRFNSKILKKRLSMIICSNDRKFNTNEFLKLYDKIKHIFQSTKKISLMNL